MYSTGISTPNIASGHLTPVVLIFLGYPGSDKRLESTHGTLALTLRGVGYIPGDLSVTIVTDIDVEFPGHEGRLPTIEPTRSNIKQTLNAVLGSLPVKGRCTVILSGHGKEEGGAYYLDLPNEEKLFGLELSQIFQESVKGDTEVLVVAEACSGAHLFDLGIHYEVKKGKFTLLKDQVADPRIKGTLIVLAGSLADAQTIQTKRKKTIYTLMSYTMWHYSLDKSVTDNLASLLVYLHNQFETSLKKEVVKLPQVPRISSSRLLPEPISIGAFRILQASP